MSADVEGYLRCSHCGVEFLGSRSQINHVKYDGSKAYCSPLCRKAGNPLRRPKPTHGPCPTCGKMFASRTSKIYCSMQCYIRSPALKELANTNTRTIAIRNSHAKRYEDYVRANTLPCTECGKPYYRPPARRRRFCSTLCYRRHLAKRFDRWVANPQEIALPQAFDEFLTQNELPCLVKGCNWSGKMLSLHMNTAHGVPKDEFKRAAGFNLKSGIISADLAEVLQRRENQGVALASFDHTGIRPTPSTRNYHSLEGKEHMAKARAMLMAEPGPMHTCRQCGKDFQQSTRMGRTMYCSTRCRSKFYSVSGRKHPLSCSQCGKTFIADLHQVRRMEAGKPVVCSMRCRQVSNARKRQRH